MAERHVIALGGGGFSVGKSLAIDRYVLRQARRANPRVAFVGTASGDAETYVAKFMEAFAGLGCEPSHLPLFRRTPELRDFVANQDVIYVGGGNTRSMLAVWHEWGLPELLREAWEAGTVLAGISAGAICWFEQGVTDSGANTLDAMTCLGLVPGSCCPHYDGEPDRKPGYRALLETGRIAPGLAIDDEAAAHFVGGQLHQALCTEPGSGAYRLELEGGKARVTPLPATLLEDAA